MTFFLILPVLIFEAKTSLFRKTFFDKIDEFIPYPPTHGYRSAKSLANGKLIFYYLHDLRTGVKRINEVLYSFNRDEWTTRTVEISDDDKNIMLQCDPFPHILRVKNFQSQRWDKHLIWNFFSQTTQST